MNTKKLLLPLLGTVLILTAGCVGMAAGRHTHATSLVQFLYPNDSQHVEAVGIPTLRLPLRVGIAFVPSTSWALSGLSGAAKADLLKRVAGEFRGLAYVKSIEVIPDAYLRPSGGFENLDQVKEMFGLDVIALVSYDQVQFTHEGFLSLAYWTIVGAWVIEGEKNDTQTLMDCVVFDIPSRKMLFRAPGTSRVKASTTPINLSEELQNDSRHGFDLATTDMIANLKLELEDFKVRVKESPDEFKVEHRPGYTGAGSLGPLSALGMAILSVIAIRRRVPCTKA